MKRLALIAVLLVACSRRTIVDFEFQAAGGHPVYRSTSLTALRRDLAPAIHPVVALVETPSFDDARYRQQIALLESLDAEELQLLFVAACTCGTNASGYSTTVETARRIAGAGPRFHVTLLDGEGVVLRESDAVLPPSDIEEVVTATHGRRGAA